MEIMDKNGENLLLIGFMGCGKSSVAREISRLSGRLMIDTDSLIELYQGRRIVEIFAEFGEGRFREMESELVRNMEKSLKHAIIATGGGMPLFCDLSALGRIIFLDLPFEAILARMSDEERVKRPLFSDINKARELFDTRRAGYLECSELVLDATCQPIDLARLVLGLNS